MSGRQAPVVGIDLGGTNIKGGLVLPGGAVIARQRRKTRLEEGYSAVIGRMCELVRSLGEGAGFPLGEVPAVGVGSPGPLNSRTGVIIDTPNLKWKNVPLKELMEAELRRPVFVENDANAACYGEWVAGAGRGASRMAIFTLGTGVGGGLILEGVLQKGPDDSAGHLGHIPVEFDGRRCPCGAIGCLEAYASATALVKRAGELALTLDEEDCPLRRTAAGELTAKLIHEFAREGCPHSRRLLEETGRYLAVAAGGVVNALNLELIVVGGGMIEAGEMLLGPMREELVRRTLPTPRARVSVVPAQLGDDAGVVGAAECARRRLAEAVKW